MHASPDRPDRGAREAPEAAFTALLTKAARRSRRIAAARGAAVGLVVAALALAAGVLTRTPAWIAGAAAAVAAIAGGAIAIARQGSADAAAVRAIETRTPDSRNLVRTAFELAARDIVAPPPISQRIIADATTVLQRVDLARILPASRAVASLGVALVFVAASWSIARGFGADAGADSVVARPSSDRAASISSVRVEIAPPDYAAEPSQQHADPDRISALAGSRIRLTVEADAARVTIEASDANKPAGAAASAPAALAPIAGREFAGEITLLADGFLTVTPVAATGTPGNRRLIPLTVTPDELPRVRIVKPGQDLLVADGGRTIDIGIEADDDLGLQSLALAFTRVSGSGENFTFTGGDLPVAIERASGRRWTATASWNLAPLGLEPGDLVIYRAVARDRRPNAPPVESDAFIVEIVTPGSIASEGFAIDDRENRYAISQQMVILKTERLIAARAKLPREEFEREAGSIAAEQRQVRAEFVFMMGGELIDEGLDPTELHEHAEAEKEDELAAGRLRNQGRADLMAAIRFMSRAAAALADVNPAAALPIEKEALTYLQRAFSRNRYILRTLTERERLDLTRRLTGVLASLARDRRPAAVFDEAERVIATRALLAASIELGRAASTRDAVQADIRARAGELAQRALAIDSAPGPFADAAAALARMEFDTAARHLTSAAAVELPAGASRPGSPAFDTLEAAFADALRARPTQAPPPGGGGPR
jgi:hypothetical protein